MKIRRQIVVFDAPDLAAESSFWAALLGGTVEADEDWHSVVVDGEWRLGVQLAPNHVRPDWPDGTPQQQLHLDLWVDRRRSNPDMENSGRRVAVYPSGRISAKVGAGHGEFLAARQAWSSRPADGGGGILRRTAVGARGPGRALRQHR